MCVCVCVSSRSSPRNPAINPTVGRHLCHSTLCVGPVHPLRRMDRPERFAVFESASTSLLLSPSLYARVCPCPCPCPCLCVSLSHSRAGPARVSGSILACMGVCLTTQSCSYIRTFVLIRSIPPRCLQTRSASSSPGRAPAVSTHPRSLSAESLLHAHAHEHPRRRSAKQRHCCATDGYDTAGRCQPWPAWLRWPRKSATCCSHMLLCLAHACTWLTFQPPCARFVGLSCQFHGQLACMCS